MMDTVYYLTGRGGQLHTGVGQGLLDRGYSVSGRASSGKFDTLPIKTQIELIQHDLQGRFWHQHALILAVSYGAYLLMQTLVHLEPYPGSILILPPVLGGINNGEQMRYFSPPRADKLQQHIENHQFPKPRQLEIHVGDSDWQSPFQLAQHFAQALNGHCVVVPNTGHDLGKEYVSPILDKWLAGVH